MLGFRAPVIDGGVAPLEAPCRRVAGVSRLYCCNSPLAATHGDGFKGHGGPYRRIQGAPWPTKGGFAAGHVRPTTTRDADTATRTHGNKKVRDLATSQTPHLETLRQF